MKKIIYLISVVVFLFIYGCTQPTNTPQQITSSEQGTAIQKREQRFFSTIPYAHWTPHQENIPIELLENYTVSYEYT
ncbi:MAG: hypothetical protein LBG59_03240 [Candidatus Peribacteria bacterium]|jgi:hypothetical protein|nr:hypothetical protein [Candidatus Peribacteria bacterium]